MTAASQTRSHEWTPPPAGHIDGPRSCATCGEGPTSIRHARGHARTSAALAGHDRAAIARVTAERWREGLATIHGQEWAVAALDRVLAALDGEIDPVRLGFSGIRIHLHGRAPDEPDQQALPLAGAA